MFILKFGKVKIPMRYNFSDKVKDMKPSAIREIFKSLTNPDIISFAAGNPSPESFPVDEFSEISAEVFKNNASMALQYSITEGYPKLREQVASRLKSKFNIDIDNNDTIITTGGQQGIDLTAKCLCNEGDTIICENPSFIGAMNAFRAYNVNLVGVDLEDDGINIEKLEKAIADNKNVKMLYLIPTFHNPAGICTSFEKRKKIYEIALRNNIIILEDNPYGELRFNGEDIPTIKSIDTDNIVVYCSSFSKVLSAGMRVGFLCGPKEIIGKVVVTKQVNDVHTNIFFQMLVSKFLEKYDIDAHISSIRKLYKHKAELMLSCLDEKMPKWVKYTRPDGGLFIWVTLPDEFDSNEVAKLATQKLVAVVPGSSFEPDVNAFSHSFRLNYSMPSDEQIVEGVDRLAEALYSLEKKN